MSHVIIIRDGDYANGQATTSQEETSAHYEFEYSPAHDLPEHVVDKRIAKIRRVLLRLAADVTAPAGEHED